jgi:hypothetical protein
MESKGEADLVVKFKHMALSKSSVQKAKEILKLINTRATTVEFEVYDRNSEYNEPDILYLVDKKADGGFESVFTHIENIGTVLRELWDEHKRAIPNTFTERTEGDITRIGWF